MPHPSQVRRLKGLLRHTLDQLLLVDLFRYLVVAARFMWYAKIRRRLTTYDANAGPGCAVAPNTVMHNLKGLRDLAVNRSHLLVRPLSVLEVLPVDARVLSIGPRTEGELLSLAAHGFLWDRITGLDLISYSPRVRVGDMHQMQFADDSFDAVVAGWVLAYSEDPARAAREILRVTRHGGIVAVGVEYNPQSPEEVIRNTGYLPGAYKSIGSCDDILSFFGNAVDHVYHQHVVTPRQKAEVAAFCVIFSVRKNNQQAAPVTA